MDVSNFKSLYGPEDVTLDQAHSLLSQMQVIGCSGCFIAADPPGGLNQGLLVPESQTGSFGTAPYVDPQNDMSGTPADAQIALVIWVDQGPGAPNYHSVGEVLQALSRGKELATVLQD